MPLPSPRYTWSLHRVIAMSGEIHSYIYRSTTPCAPQHPEWVEPNGNSPTCDSYESRLAELLGLSSRTNSGCWCRLSYAERRSFGSDLRNCVGERPTIRLNARLKFVMD